MKGSTCWHVHFKSDAPAGEASVCVPMWYHVSLLIFLIKKKQTKNNISEWIMILCLIKLWPLKWLQSHWLTFSFLLQVLFNQFKYFYNLYFLLLACSQFIKELRLGALYTYWVPLVCIHLIVFASPSLISVIPGVWHFLSSIYLCQLCFYTHKCHSSETTVLVLISSGLCPDYHYHKRSSGRNQMLRSRQRSELSDLQQTFSQR